MNALPLAQPVGRLVLEDDPDNSCPYCHGPLTALTDTSADLTVRRCPRCQTTTRSTP